MRTHSLAIVVVALLLIGCSARSPVYTPRREPAQVAPLTEARCAADGGPLYRRDTDVHAGTLPPAGFRPVSVVRCTEVSLTVERPDLVFVVEESRAPLTPGLIEALRLPDEPLITDPRTVCDASAEVSRYLMLADRDDRAHVARVPITACGKTRDEVHAALDAMTWRTVGRVEVRVPE